MQSKAGREVDKSSQIQNIAVWKELTGMTVEGEQETLPPYGSKEGLAGVGYGVSFPAGIQCPCLSRGWAVCNTVGISSSGTLAFHEERSPTAA